MPCRCPARAAALSQPLPQTEPRHLLRFAGSGAARRRLGGVADVLPGRSEAGRRRRGLDGGTPWGAVSYGPFAGRTGWAPGGFGVAGARGAQGTTDPIHAGGPWRVGAL